jgi:hypothetical protein
MTQQDRITDLMVEAVLTGTTCGEGCWFAREKVCRCSCGGRNHGCLLKDGAKKPVRNSKIDGERYELAAVGCYADLYRRAAELLRAEPPQKTRWAGLTMRWTATDKGSPVRLKAASKVQKEKWEEVKNCGVQYPYLLWKSTQQDKEHSNDSSI